MDPRHHTSRRALAHAPVEVLPVAHLCDRSRRRMKIRLAADGRPRHSTWMMRAWAHATTHDEQGAALVRRS